MQNFDRRIGRAMRALVLLGVSKALELAAAVVPDGHDGSFAPNSRVSVMPGMFAPANDP